MVKRSDSVLNPTEIMQHYWSIKDFTSYYDFIDDHRSLTISSEEFKVYDSNDYTFFFKLTIFSKSISCSLYRYPKTKFNCMSCRLWLKGGDKYLENEHFIIDCCEESSETSARIVFESTDLSSCEKRKDLFPDKQLIIIGEFRILNGAAAIQSLYTPKPYQSMKNHFKQLLESNNGSDVVFEVEDEELKAHKLILEARSPVFAAMFDHDMVEKNTNKVKIVDISEPVFSLLLNFVYTDELPTDLDVELLLGILQAACKYQLDGLQNLCEAQLFKLITIDNAEDMRETAEIHNLTNFMRSVETFIKFNPKLN